MVKINTADTLDSLPVTAVAPSLPADKKKLRKKTRGPGKGTALAGNQLTPHESYEVIEVHRSELLNAPYNPRTITPRARQKLKEKILKIGLVAPITWNKRTRHIVGGHQRVNVLDSIMGTKNYRIRVAAVDMDEKAEKETNVFLNNETAAGEFDWDKLESLFKNDKISVTEAGFDLNEYSVLFGDDDLVADADELEELAERLKSVASEIDKSVEAVADENNEGFYLVVVFPSPDECTAFADVFDISDDRFIAGQAFWNMLQNVGITNLTKLSDTELRRRFIETILDCDRCHCKHENLIFRPFTEPLGEHNYFAICPETGEPLLRTVSQADLDAINAEADDNVGSDDVTGIQQK